MTIQSCDVALFSQTSVRRQLDDMYEQRVFDLQDAVRKTFGAVSCEYRHPSLGDHGACIQLRAHEMHAGTVFAVAGVQRTRMRVQPAITG